MYGLRGLYQQGEWPCLAGFECAADDDVTARIERCANVAKTRTGAVVFAVRDDVATANAVCALFGVGHTTFARRCVLSVEQTDMHVELAIWCFEEQAD